MELSTEGLAAAASTRETVAAKKRQLEQSLADGAKDAAVDKKPVVPKKPHLNRPPPACTHEVAIPEGFDVAKITLDEAVHGASCVNA